MIVYERTFDGDLVAVAEISIGPSRRTERLGLGSWPGPDFDPAGLRGSPIVVLPGSGGTELARRGALRSGGQPTVLILPGHAPRLGIQLLVAHQEGVDVTIVEGGSGPVLNAARYLGGRPIPALPLDDPDAVARMLEGCQVDLDVPVPSLEGAARERIATLLAPLALHDLHHLVEVDPRPAFDELGLPIDEAGPRALTAAAAGVLAGRVSVRSRRWRQA